MAKWLIPPLTDTDKHLDKEWGLHLLLDSDDPRDKTGAIFGAPDHVIKQKLPPKLMRTLFGTTRELFAICNNGTTAVTIALSNSASPSHVRLVAMGSYTGAYSFTEKYSSVPVDIDDFYQRESLSLERIVSLPYLRRKEIGTTVSNKFEDDCLSTLKERLLGFAMRGTPVGSLCLELILSGNGLQLSRRFCEKLRTLCTKTGVAIIADEILTGFRCVSDPTVLLSDALALKPDFIVLGKFIGCGVVLKDYEVMTTSWSSRKKRRYPTTNCPMVQLEHLSVLLHKYHSLLQKVPKLFNKVGEVVTDVFPSSSEGFGLIWFIEDNRTREVPAPKGVRRLLFKIISCSTQDMVDLKERLRHLPVTRRRGGRMGLFEEHILKFRSVSEEFVHKWHSGMSESFKNRSAYVFGLAHATRAWVETDRKFARLTEWYNYFKEKVAGIKQEDVKRFLNGVPNNCGSRLYFLSTVYDGLNAKKVVKVLKPTDFTLVYVGGSNKRRRRGSSSSSNVVPPPKNGISADIPDDYVPDVQESGGLQQLMRAGAVVETPTSHNLDL